MLDWEDEYRQSNSFCSGDNYYKLELDPEAVYYEDVLIAIGREEYHNTWFEYIEDYCDFS